MKLIRISAFSPLTLAYIGDGSMSYISAPFLIKQGNCQVNKLHKQASRLVKSSGTVGDGASAGATFYPGRRSSVQREVEMQKSYTTAKNATTGDYRRATGFEAVMGYLYLTDQCAE